MSSDTTNKAIAIIPARGGSKRIPRKNVKHFAGSPIIKYSIEAALKSSCFEQVMVSTEDEEVARLSLSFGASVPFMRSQENASDIAGLADVLQEVLLSYRELGQHYEYFCCITAAAPLISDQRIQEGYELLKSTGADSVITVSRFSYPIQRALIIDKDKRLQMIQPEYTFVRSQDLSPCYHDCGQFYWMRTKSLLEQKRLFSYNCVPLVLPESEMQDIDSVDDWKLAEIKFALLHNNAKSME